MLQILERTGVELPHPGLLSRFTDSKRPDAQAGVTLALGAMAGADIFGHMGICGVDQATSLDMLVCQDEVISYVERVLRPPAFSGAALGLGEIDAVDRGLTRRVLAVRTDD